MRKRHKVIVTCAITGAAHTPCMSPYLPITPQQIADEAIAAYGSIVRNHPDHNLAPDAQYKLGQCHEEAGNLDEALEAYVTLAATYPKSPLIANVMLRTRCERFSPRSQMPATSISTGFSSARPFASWVNRIASNASVRRNLGPKETSTCHAPLEESFRSTWQPG